MIASELKIPKSRAQVLYNYVYDKYHHDGEVFDYLDEYTGLVARVMGGGETRMKTEDMQQAILFCRDACECYKILENVKFELGRVRDRINTLTDDEQDSNECVRVDLRVFGRVFQYYSDEKYDTIGIDSHAVAFGALKAAEKELIARKENLEGTIAYSISKLSEYEV